MKKDISHLPKEYPSKNFDEKAVDPNPLNQFENWFRIALNANIKEPTAMSLATASKSGKPSVRTVLLKSYNENGFVFFTNYESRKGIELDENPVAAVVFWWGNLGRQVRIEGNTEKISEKESENYFHSRPFDSQISAWASAQSRPVESREILETRYNQLKKEYEGKVVPRPPYWGGYRLVPNTFEFWQGWANRLHDRILYTKIGSYWRIERLAP